MRADFAWNCTHLLTKNIHFNITFCWNTSEKEKNYAASTMTIPIFFSVLSVVFIGSLLVAVKTAGLLVMRVGCKLEDVQSYCRCSEWPPMAWRSQVWQSSAGRSWHPPCWCVLVAAYSQMVCRVAFNSLIVLIGF